MQRISGPVGRRRGELFKYFFSKCSRASAESWRRAFQGYFCKVVLGTLGRGLFFLQSARASGEPWRPVFRVECLQSALGPVGRRGGELFRWKSCKSFWCRWGHVAANFLGCFFCTELFSWATGEARRRIVLGEFLQSIRGPNWRRGGYFFGWSLRNVLWGQWCIMAMFTS